mmetsp:Transcript_20344/g.22664  ORF Transcript_20344/g.22664 Transcript_20344/m.22664 type:complete len:92 (+) Transcript_20344:142-417(+)
MSFTTTDNLLNNIREIHNYTDTDSIMISNPSVNNANDVNEKHCDDNYETKRITYDMDNYDDDEDSTYDFAKSRNPWYGSAFFHWLVFDVIG